MANRSLTEAEEEGVHTHVVDAEEAVRDEVAPNHNRLHRRAETRQAALTLSTGRAALTYNNRHPVVVQHFRLEAGPRQPDPPGEEEEGQNSWKRPSSNISNKQD